MIIDKNQRLIRQQKHLSFKKLPTAAWQGKSSGIFSKKSSYGLIHTSLDM